MKWSNACVVVVVAGLLLGLPAVVAAQRPSEGSERANTGSIASGGGGAPSGAGPASPAGGGAGPGGFSNPGGTASSGNGGSGGNGNTGTWPNPGMSGWGGNNLRPREEVIQRPGFADAPNNRANARTYSAGGSEVPWYSRPRGGDVPTTGTAIPRSEWVASRPPGGGGSGNPGWGDGGGYPGYGYPGYGYWQGYGYWSNYGWYLYPGYWGMYGYGYPDCGYGAYGMGYFYYNPFGWNYYGNCGYYGSGMYGSDFGGSVSSGAVGGSSYYATRGGLRLKVKPTNARVFVDGYYAGNIDSFDGSFQKLAIERGRHKIEITAVGYAPAIFEIEIKGYETIVWEGNLEKIK
jgi:hypothetical protein